MSYTIRQVATQFHMQPSTLRYYEDQGLLTNVERTETGQRIYEDGLSLFGVGGSVRW